MLTKSQRDRKNRRIAKLTAINHQLSESLDWSLNYKEIQEKILKNRKAIRLLTRELEGKLESQTIKLFIINNPDKQARWIATKLECSIDTVYYNMRKLMPDNRP